LRGVLAGVGTLWTFVHIGLSIVRLDGPFLSMDSRQLCLIAALSIYSDMSSFVRAAYVQVLSVRLMSSPFTTNHPLNFTPISSLSSSIVAATAGIAFRVRLASCRTLNVLSTT
jgi:hypothetical protein